MAKFAVEPLCGLGSALEPVSAVNEGGELLSPRLDASEYQCAICCELLLDPVVGAHAAAMYIKEVCGARSRTLSGVKSVACQPTMAYDLQEAAGTISASGASINGSLHVTDRGARCSAPSADRTSSRHRPSLSVRVCTCLGRAGSMLCSAYSIRVMFGFSALLGLLWRKLAFADEGPAPVPCRGMHTLTRDHCQVVP